MNIYNPADLDSAIFRLASTTCPRRSFLRSANAVDGKIKLNTPWGLPAPGPPQDFLTDSYCDNQSSLMVFYVLLRPLAASWELFWGPPFLGTRAVPPAPSRLTSQPRTGWQQRWRPRAYRRTVIIVGPRAWARVAERPASQLIGPGLLTGAALHERQMYGNPGRVAADRAQTFRRQDESPSGK